MRKALVLVALTACAAPPPPKPAPAPQPKAVSAAQLEDRAGDAVETAVDVPATAPNDGVDWENEWIYNRFGRFRRRGGGTGTLNGRRYDVVDVELPNGDKKKVFFDITENWKNWKPQ